VSLRRRTQKSASWVHRLKSRWKKREFLSLFFYFFKSPPFLWYNKKRRFIMNNKLKRALDFFVQRNGDGEGSPPLVEVVVYDESYRESGDFRYHFTYYGLMSAEEAKWIDRWPEELSWPQIRARNAARIRLFRIPRFISRDGKIIAPSPWYTMGGVPVEDSLIPAAGIRELAREASRHGKGKPLAEELQDGALIAL
jgi:hypothetical protein